MSTAALKPSDGDGGDNEDGVHGDRSDVASAGTISILFTQRATRPNRPSAAIGSTKPLSRTRLFATAAGVAPQFPPGSSLPPCYD